LGARIVQGLGFLGLAIVSVFIIFLSISAFFPAEPGRARTEYNLPQNYRLSTFVFDDAGHFSSGDSETTSFEASRAVFDCLYTDLETIHTNSHEASLPDSESRFTANNVCDLSSPTERENVLNIFKSQVYKRIVSVVHVHGWTGNAKPDEDYSREFKKIVEQLAEFFNRPESEKTLINGVLLAWNGARTRLQLAEPFFYFQSKQIADEVSRGHMNYVLQALNRYHTGDELVDSDGAGVKHHLIVIGHSFGGRIVFNMTSDVLYANVLASATPESHDAKASRIDRRVLAKRPSATDSPNTAESSDEKLQLIRGFGDLIVLLNPAFEASRYTLIDDLASSIDFRSDQPPLMLTLSTSADWVTHEIFPKSRLYEMMVRSKSRPQSTSQRDAMIETIGNYQRYRTHNVVHNNADRQGCDGDEVELHEINGKRPNNPFYIAYDNTGLIMEGHSKIYNECLKIFLSKFVDERVINRIEARD